MASDWLELSTPWEDCIFDLAVHAPGGALIGVFPRVTADPLRSHGTWLIVFTSENGPADAFIPADQVGYFVLHNTVERDELP